MENNDVKNDAPVNDAPKNAQDNQDVDIDLTDDESINLFIEGIMDEKGLADQSEEMKEDIFANLKTRLLEEIDRSLVAELPDDKLDELSKTVAKDGQVAPETVGEMVKEAGINVEEVVGGTMAKFRELYLSEGEAEEQEEPTDSEEKETEENGAE